MSDSTPVTTPLTDEVIDRLTIGTHVAFTGVIYTAGTPPTSGSSS